MDDNDSVEASGDTYPDDDGEAAAVDDTSTKTDVVDVTAPASVRAS